MSSGLCDDAMRGEDLGIGVRHWNVDELGRVREQSTHPSSLMIVRKLDSSPCCDLPVSSCMRVFTYEGWGVCARRGINEEDVRHLVVCGEY